MMYNECMLNYFYKLDGSMKNAHICDDHKVICFCNEHYHVHVTFYQQLNMIELSIIDKQSHENLFYLHFERKDIISTRKNILSFF